MQKTAAIATAAVAVLSCRSELSPSFDAFPPATLTILTVGTAAVPRIVSTPAGISCPGDCEGVFTTAVALETSGGFFVHWSAPCAGAGSSCDVAILGSDLTMQVAGVLSGTILWRHDFQGSNGSNQTANGVATGPEIAVLSGQFSPVTDFPVAGGGFDTVPSEGLEDAFLFAVTPRTGEPLWRAVGGSIASDSGEGVCIRDGRLLWTGRLMEQSTFDFDGEEVDLAVPNPYGAFLHELTLSGAWVSGFATDLAAGDEGINVDLRDGRVAVVSERSQTDIDVRVSWVDSATITSSYDFAEDGDQLVRDVVVVPGAAAFVGFHDVDFAGNPSVGLADGYLFVTSGGSKTHAEYFGGSENDGLFALAVHPDGRLLAAGFLGSPAMVGPDALTPDQTDLLLAWIRPSGEGIVGAAVFGGSGNEVAHDVAISPSGSIVVCGTVTGTITIGGQSADPAPLADAFVVLFDEDFTFRWLVAFGTPGVDIATACAFDEDGGVIVAGQHDQTVTLLDAFLLRIAP